MRRLCLILVSALLTVTTVAFADGTTASKPIILSAPAAGSDLPDMGSPTTMILSQSDEYRLGAMVTRELRDQNALIEDPEVNEYMQTIGQRLAAQSAMGGRDFHFFVIKDDSHQRLRGPRGLRLHLPGTHSRHLH